MFNGKCRVWKAADGTACGDFKVKGGKGIATLRRTVSPTDSVNGWADEGASTEAALRSKMEYIAGFLPLREAIGDEAYDKARSLFEAANEEDTRAEAFEELELYRQDSETNELAGDVLYGVQRFARMARAAQKDDPYVRGVMEADEVGAFNLKKSLKKVAKKAKKSAFINPVQTLKFAKRNPLINPIATARFIKKNPSLSAAMALAPPLAAVKLLQTAKKGDKNSVRKIAEIRRLSMGLPARPGADTPPEEYVEQANQALFNMRTAEAMQSEAYDNSSYEEPQYEEQYDEAPSDEYYEEDGESVEGEPDELDEGDFDEIGMFGAKGMKRIGKLAKFVNKQKWVSSIPYVGPGVAAAAKVVADAKLGDAAAKEKVKTIETMAKAGVPKAEAALANINTANALLNQSAAKGGGIIAWFKSLFGIK